jgi:hypothetical protein
MLRQQVLQIVTVMIRPGCNGCGYDMDFTNSTGWCAVGPTLPVRRLILPGESR